jgi:hypothetical protein
VTPAEAQAFAEEWIEAWNAHDLERVLAHYADDVAFSSPFAIELTGRADGTIEGKEALRAYFARALEAFPDLHFTELRVARGASSVCLLYRSVRDLQAAETMVVDERGLVTRVWAHYVDTVEP